MDRPSQLHENVADDTDLVSDFAKRLLIARGFGGSAALITLFEHLCPPGGGKHRGRISYCA